MVYLMEINMVYLVITILALEFFEVAVQEFKTQNDKKRKSGQ